MKNIMAAFSLFFVMIIGIFFSTNFINHSCANLQALNSSLESYVANEDYGNAYNISLDYIAQWKKTSKTLTLFIHHEDLDHVSNEVLKLTQYIKVKDKSEALATVHAMKYLINHIIDHEKVSINNIL